MHTVLEHAGLSELMSALSHDEPSAVLSSLCDASHMIHAGSEDAAAGTLPFELKHAVPGWRAVPPATPSHGGT